VSNPSAVPKTGAESGRKLSSPLGLVAKSVVATGLVLGTILGALYVSGSGGFVFAHDQGDELTPAQVQQRQAAFNVLGTVKLVEVTDAEVPRAVASMQLSAAAKTQLLADMATHAAPAAVRSDAPAALGASAIPLGTSKSLPPVPPPEAAASSAPHEMPLHLAWISLWDTDAQDGDTVRLDSQGYSRTIILKNQPMTFAVPVPASGVITVTGVTDGDGGGITVGLASGASKAVFPIMSTGQVLGLKVKVE
jgi:hypothetical protein